MEGGIQLHSRQEKPHTGVQHEQRPCYMEYAAGKAAGHWEFHTVLMGVEIDENVSKEQLYRGSGAMYTHEVLMVQTHALFYSV